MRPFRKQTAALFMSTLLAFSNIQVFSPAAPAVFVSAKEDAASTQENASTQSEKKTETTETTTAEAAQEEDTEVTETTEKDTTSETGTTGDSSTEATVSEEIINNSTQAGTAESDSSTKKEQTAQSGSGEQITGQVNSDISGQKKNEIQTGDVKEIKNQIADEDDSAESANVSGTFIPKIYNDTRLSMKNNIEYISGYIYFNQTDSAWNQNGYCIAKAGCGPTSMAVVISTLTGRWVTPLDTAIWGYEHGFYSRAGSSHAMIPAMASAYGLNCEGVGTSYQAIKNALKSGKPVVCLMGPGYFTRGGHFMVLVAIDEKDNVTVADVGSRTRSTYKYRLSDVISQSKSASAGGPFWIMSVDEDAEEVRETSVHDYMTREISKDFEEVSYMNLQGGLSDSLVNSRIADVSIKKVVEILKPSGSENAQSLLNGVNLFAAMNTSTVSVTVPSEAEDSERGMGQTGSDMGVMIKQDIAKRQWDKKIHQDRIEDYLCGTL